MKLLLDRKKEYGVVLDGGGARGAYQIGAWKALKEAGIRIHAVAGTSVGALNGALICMDDLKKAQDIWKSMTFSKVMNVDDGWMEGLFEREHKVKDVLSQIWSVVTAGGIDVTPLKELIHELVDEEKIRQSGKEFYLLTFSLTDFNGILQDNAKCSELIQALEQESTLFESYMRNPDTEKKEALERSMKRTKHAVYDLPFQYRRIGELRYAKTWSIRSSYEVYCTKRDAILSMEDNVTDYVSRLYEVYDMQDYLKDYAGTLMNYTIEEGDVSYQKKVPTLISVPLVVIFAGILLLFGIAEMAALMKETIMAPIFKLVHASQKIAANDFFIRDVEVDNKDELGELVRAFNKMKYATGEYIQALEEKRKTLDLLHEEELEKLETEKRLEMTKLELLKSQINPHFLFNTLNVIGGMASLEEAETTEKMIRALSALFRYNLKNQDTEVCLSQELKIMEDYMYLQQMRFGDRITYRKDCSVDADKVIVPAFTFQPLVENAIIHGLSKKEEGGTVRVHIWQKDGFTLITIGDNGLGMDEAALMHLRGELEKEDGKTGIGLGNIFRRIRAMYQDGNVEIYSKKDVGTVVKIQIRHKEVGEHDVPCVGGGR